MCALFFCSSQGAGVFHAKMFVYGKPGVSDRGIFFCYNTAS